VLPRITSYFLQAGEAPKPGKQIVLGVNPGGREGGIDRQANARRGLRTAVTGIAGVLGFAASAVEVSESSGNMDRSLRNITDEYEIHEIVGKGQYGICRRAVRRSTGNEVAVKSISKLKIRSEEERSEVEREIAIMRHLEGHENIVKLFDVFEDRTHIHLVMELCKGGELFDQIITKGHYSEKEAAELVRTMLLVIRHMHSLGVMHRDLKPENFLFDKATMKATDFGLSSFLSPQQRLDECVGSSYYIAPEVLKRDYSVEADVWSAGVILYILLCGSPPFYGANDKEILQKILKYKDGGINFHFKPWPQISDGAKECVLMMLKRDARSRGTAEQILSHPWMRENGTASEKPIANEVVSRLKKFIKMSKLQRMVTRMIAEMLSPAEVHGLKTLFQKLDKDSDGVITVDELRIGLKEWGYGNEGLEYEVQSMMAKLDMDGSGTIDLEEFMCATMNRCQLEMEENLLQAFQQIDTDGNGLLTREELQNALVKFGLFEAGDIDEILEEADQNHDGLIDYSEFASTLGSEKLMKKLSSGTNSVEMSSTELHQDSKKKMKTSSAVFTMDVWTEHP